MRILVACALPGAQEVLPLDLPPGATVVDALDRSGVFSRHPSLAAGEPAVWGEPCGRDRVLREGDRVELLRPVSADAKANRRARAALSPSRRSRSAP